jgi:hypothetical protein
MTDARELWLATLRLLRVVVVIVVHAMLLALLPQWRRGNAAVVISPFAVAVVAAVAVAVAALAA